MSLPHCLQTVQCWRLAPAPATYLRQRVRLVGRWQVSKPATRTQFIQRTWGIDSVVASLDQLPRGQLYDNVIMVNVVEHVYDVVGLMKELRGHISKDARVFISTVNAKGIVGTLAGTYWAMFKERDHVSFPSVTSLRQLADGAGYQLTRGWTAELPLETPLGLMVAARDFIKERRARRKGDPPSRFQATTMPSEPSVTHDRGRTRKKRLLATIYRSAKHIDPTRHMVGAVQRAATVKGVFIPAV
jgi:hypothetical protein